MVDDNFEISDDSLQLLQEFLNQLPEWADRLSKRGELVIGTQLCTRDGRRMGNAWVVGFKQMPTYHYYEILTDAGTRLRMNNREIASQFFRPKYVGRLSEILAKFDRQ